MTAFLLGTSNFFGPSYFETALVNWTLLFSDLNYLLFICKNIIFLDSRDPLLLLFVMAKWPLWQAVCGSSGSMAAAMLSVIPMAKAV